jgi:anti-sigma factor RsiW
MNVDEFTQIRRYLLGQLPEDELDTAEERYFNQADALASVELVEAELMDAFVDGTLTPDERICWETYLTAHPESRERLAFARALRQRFQARRRAWKQMASWIAVAAALLLGFFFWNRREPAPVKAPVLFAITLSPGTLRAAGEAPQVVKIPLDADLVRITLAGPAAARAVVKLVDNGASVWTAELRQTAVEIPVGALKDGDYVATTLNSAGEELADYSFRVQRLTP